MARPDPGWRAAADRRRTPPARSRWKRGGSHCLANQGRVVRVVRAAFEAGARPGDLDDGGGVVLRALRAHNYALGAHLDVEENAVIPLLLALEPAEFVRYYDSPISLLVPRRE